VKQKTLALVDVKQKESWLWFVI